jgi:hypothetical protein
VKSTARFASLTLALLLTTAVDIQDVPSIFTNQALPPAPTTYTLDDSFDAVKSDVDREAINATAPSSFVLYSESTDRQAIAPPVAPNNGSNAPTLASASGVAGWIATLAPTAADRAALRKYLSIVHPSSFASDAAVATSNAGLSLFFNNEVNGNACLQKRAVEFYTAVGRATKDLQTPVSGLARNVHAETQGKLSPGWLWKLAMQSSGGDGGLALMLIGMCGHDDHGQGEFGFRDESEAARSSINYKINRYSEIRLSLQSQMTRPSLAGKALVSGIDRQMTSLKNSHAFTTITCPVKPNAFFSSQGLGRDVDISESLRKEIERTQNPDGALDLPAKNYHIYSSAFMACQLIEEGMSPANAKRVEAEAAKIYRGIRLCQVLEDTDVGSVPGYRTAQDFLLSHDAPAKCRQRNFASANSAACELVDEAQFYRQQIRDPVELRKKIDGLFATADASVLYRRWFFAGLSQKFGTHLPCTDTQVAGPKELLKPESSADPNASGFNFHTPFKPLAWTNARYENAKRKLATWVVDSKWTIAQHQVGAAFAAKVCKRRPANETLEQAACRIDAAKSTASPARATR